MVEVGFKFQHSSTQLITSSFFFLIKFKNLHRYFYFYLLFVICFLSILKYKGRIYYHGFLDLYGFLIELVHYISSEWQARATSQRT